MKRLKYIFLVGILACTIGCQKENIELNPIEINEPDTVAVVEPEPAQPTQVVEDKQEETIEEIIEEKISYSDVKEIDDYIIENLTLEDDEEIEACEWVNGRYESNKCFRVRICYKEEPENEYKHKRDFFVFYDSDELTSITVDYPSKDDYDAPRHVIDANDFEARFDDVNFDGYEDLLICLGYYGPNAGSYWCAYLYDRGDYVYNESFEKISNYRIELASEVIYSSYMEQAAPIDQIFKYDATKKEFTEVCSYKGMDGEIFRVIADLILYDNLDGFDEDEQDWQIVSSFGEQGEAARGTLELKDGNEIQY